MPLIARGEKQRRAELLGNLKRYVEARFRRARSRDLSSRRSEATRDLGPCCAIQRPRARYVYCPMVTSLVADEHPWATVSEHVVSEIVRARPQAFRGMPLFRLSPINISGERVATIDLDLLQGTLDLLILKTLTWGPRHGYAVASWIRETTNQRLQIEEGALYTALHRMEKRGWLESEWGLSENNRKAKYYQLTTQGRKQLRAKTAVWTEYAERGLPSAPDRLTTRAP